MSQKPSPFAVKVHDVLRVAQPLRGVSDDMSGQGVRLDHEAFKVGMLICVADISTAGHVPVAMCHEAGQSVSFPWVVSQIEFFLSQGRLERAAGP